MRSHRIAVTIGADAIQVAPDTLVMSSKDEVQWEATNQRRFSIVFENDGPFGRRELGHDVAINRHQPRSKGRFKYSIVSEDTPGLSLDPVIIVEEPPTGTG